MKKYLSLFLFISLLVISCSHSKKEIKRTLDSIESHDVLLQKSKDLSLKAYSTRSRSKKRAFAKEGIAYASRCIELDSKNSACHYYRAVNTGLYYQAKVVGYQKGLKEMIEDCKVVIEIEPSYEHGGAYLILGQIYYQVPRTAARPGDVVKDIETAEINLIEAVNIDPSYPENHLYLAKIQFELGLDDKSSNSLKKGKELMENNKDSIYFNEWKKLANSIEKRLKGTANE